MDDYEIECRIKYENDRIMHHINQVLKISGCRSLFIFLDNNDEPVIYCSSGRLFPLDQAIGDSLLNCKNPDIPLSKLIRR